MKVANKRRNRIGSKMRELAMRRNDGAFRLKFTSWMGVSRWTKTYVQIREPFYFFKERFLRPFGHTFGRWV